MKTRHRPPSLVSMWMLDVFCCALGCVTLLWLLSTREAKMETARNAEALKNIARTQAELDESRLQLQQLRVSFEASESTRATQAQELREAQNQRKIWLARQADLQNELETLQRQQTNLQAELAQKNLEQATLQKQFLARDEQARTRGATIANLEIQLERLQAEQTQTRIQLETTQDMLRKKTEAAKSTTTLLGETQQKANQLEQLLQRRNQEREETLAKLKTAEERLLGLEQQLATLRAKAQQEAKAGAAAMTTLERIQQELEQAKLSIIDLMGQKAKLADQLDQLKKNSDNRFAGVTLTGRRVVFLVDMSGSMKLLDDKTAAPGKWNSVVETVAKVMRSLPDLEQFQVVVFSRQAEYLRGLSATNGAWLPYRGEPSVREVTTALRNLEPEGDTNLYDGFDLAFRLKPSKLDTIYLFSDGLPTSGPGLTATEEKTFSSSERIDRLSKHLLRTLRTVWNTPRDGELARPVRINAIGFFFESPELGAFLWALSRENQGSFVGMSNP